MFEWRTSAQQSSVLQESPGTAAIGEAIRVRPSLQGGMDTGKIGKACTSGPYSSEDAGTLASFEFLPLSEFYACCGYDSTP
jgi:hypothetical protein